MTAHDVQQLGRVLIDFSNDGRFPEEESVSSAHVESTLFPAALEALSSAKLDLESNIRQLSHDSASTVDDWIAHAKSLQHDIKRSRDLANEIVRQAEADDERLEGLHEKETYAGFLSKEVLFNDSLLEQLKHIEKVHTQLIEAELYAAQSKPYDALMILEDAQKDLYSTSLGRSTRAARLLDTKASDVRNVIHAQLDSLWKAIVHIDRKARLLSVRGTATAPGNSLEEVLQGLKSFGQIDKLVTELWQELDENIIRPRTVIEHGHRPSIRISENSIFLGDTTIDQSIETLFTDLEGVIRFLISNLPADLVEPLSKEMMPSLSSRILENWLDTAVPSSLTDMSDYQETLDHVHVFATDLDSMGWPGADSLHDWVNNAAKIWLGKRREMSMDWTRNQLSLGVGKPVITERVETRTVPRDESQLIATNGLKNTQDWDAAWDSDGGDISVGMGESSEVSTPALLQEIKQHSEVEDPTTVSSSNDEAEDDAADAWGWGDDDPSGSEQVELAEESTVAATTTSDMIAKASPGTRDITITEKYWTSSMPEPVFNTVRGIFEDGATLTLPTYGQLPVAAAAGGLFGLPTLILAMYRATSPFYYAHDPCGNMFLYNDSIWLAQKLKEFVTAWQIRTDLTPRACGMVRLEPEIKVLESFGKRAYTAELNAQRTIISDLMGGAQNFFQQDGLLEGELERSVNSVIQHIKHRAAMWESVLPYSAWASATGSMVDAVATKIINDVFDMSDIGVDEAERTATLIAHIETLDQLFVRKVESSESRNNGAVEEEQVPLTYQFADKWMKMKFLSEVLQSNLKDVKFLWFESDLSLYFTSDEVVDLIKLSFEQNVAVRQAIKEIKENPAPRQGSF